MATFLKQAAAVYPDNADVSRQLILLGDTIGKQVRESRQRDRLLSIGNALQTGGLAEGMKAAAGEGLLGEALTMQGMLEKQKGRAADEAWRRTQAETQQKQWAAGHGLQAAQLKIAQDNAALTQAQGQEKLNLLRNILGGGQQQPAAPAQSGLLDVPQAAPQAAPASFSDRFTPSAPASGLSGIPRDEVALSMLGYGDMAKTVREARKSTPQAILADTRAKETAKQTVETELAQPVAEAKARESIEGIAKAGSEALRLATHPGLNAAVGPIDQYIPAVRDQTANFRSDLGTLSTKVFITTLNRMRELSKTGGAVGSVTEKEMAKLENSMRNLSTGQGEGNMRKNLGLIAEDFNDSMANIAKAYKAQYGKDLPFTPLEIPKGGPGSSGIDAILKKYLPK